MPGGETPKDARRTASRYRVASGKPVEVEPQRMMDQIPAFQNDVDSTLQKRRPQARRRAVHHGMVLHRTQPRRRRQQHGVVLRAQPLPVPSRPEKEDGEIHYHVEVQKRYDWGIPVENRATVSRGGPGPFGMDLEQADIAHLHSSGIPATSTSPAPPTR